MSNKQITATTSGLLWAGAGVSASAIIVGTWFAPLGWQQGLTAIVLGHLLGGFLFLLAGFIGAKTGKTSMQSVQISFGEKGSVLFSVANLLQLIGWTAIMIYTGAEISAAISRQAWDIAAFGGWGVILGALVVLWLFTGSRNIGLIKMLTLIAMFIITLWLSIKVFAVDSAAAAEGGISFGTAVELGTIMPLSWLPLVSDYTRNTQKPFKVSLAATIGFSITSVWMYAIGLAGALFSGFSDVSQILIFAGLGIAGITVVILSTVTTTFLDAYSAGVSANNISKIFKETPTAVAVTVLGTVLAVTLPVTQYENFLLLIGSVFAPMIAVLVADFFIIGRRNVINRFDLPGLGLWLSGFVLYHLLVYLQVEIAVGLTMPIMVVIFVLTIILRKIRVTE